MRAGAVNGFGVSACSLHPLCTDNRPRNAVTRPGISEENSFRFRTLLAGRPILRCFWDRRDRLFPYVRIFRARNGSNTGEDVLDRACSGQRGDLVGLRDARRLMSLRTEPHMRTRPHGAKESLATSLDRSAAEDLQLRLAAIVDWSD